MKKGGKDNIESSVKNNDQQTLEIDGESFDISNLISALPATAATSAVPAKAPPETGIGDKTEKPNKDNSNESYRNEVHSNLRMTPVSKYEWRGRETQHHHQQQQQQPATEEPRQHSPMPAFSQSLIEVAPGFELPLRGSEETQDAMNRNFVMTCTCMGCTVEYLCIKDAAYGLCPICHSVTPASLATAGVAPGAHGVGLGFLQ